MRRELCHVTRRLLDMNVNGYRSRGRPKKNWMICVKDDMRMKGVSGLTTDIRSWRKNTCCTSHKWENYDIPLATHGVFNLGKRIGLSNCDLSLKLRMKMKLKHHKQLPTSE